MFISTCTLYWYWKIVANEKVWRIKQCQIDKNSLKFEVRIIHVHMYVHIRTVSAHILCTYLVHVHAYVCTVCKHEGVPVPSLSVMGLAAVCIRVVSPLVSTGVKMLARE